MKKNIVILLLLIVSLGALGFIVYDKFIKEEKIVLKECNKEEICEECICDDNNETNNDNYHSYMIGSVYTNNKEYILEEYFVSNVENGQINVQWSNAKIEKKDNILYVDDKEMGYADSLYVTSDYIFVTTAGIIGDVFTNVIDKKGNIINLENNKIYDGVQATNVYLKETGDLVVIGSKYCGIECFAGNEIVTFKNNNGKLEITKEKL